jgi:hypothetical protein
MYNFSEFVYGKWNNCIGLYALESLTHTQAVNSFWNYATMYWSFCIHKMRKSYCSYIICLMVAVIGVLLFGAYTAQEKCKSGIYWFFYDDFEFCEYTRKQPSFDVAMTILMWFVCNVIFEFYVIFLFILHMDGLLNWKSVFQE